MTALRHRVHDGAITGRALLVAAGVLLGISAVVVTASPGGFVQPGVAAAFAVFIAFGEFARITLPGGRDAAPVATAGGLAYALLTLFDETPAKHSALQVVAVVAVAMIIGIAPHVVAGRSPTMDSLARRLLAIGFAAAALRATGLDGEVRQSLQEHQGAAIVAAVMVVTIVVLTLAVEAFFAATARAGTDRAPFLAVLRNEAQAQLGIGAAIGATGALIALAAGIMGAWALPVFVIPLLLTQFSFRRYASIRATSLQTIRALSRVTELGGYTESGHSRRVSRLAVAVGREMGMNDADLLDLEYAALMHDIGQLSLPEPIPGGATVVAAPAEQRRIADFGAQVVRQTGVPDDVGTIVELQAEPYRQAHQVVDQAVPLASRIIKAVNAYDDLVGDSQELARRLDALERLRLGMAYEYDPRVVDSLSQAILRFSRSDA